MNGVRYQARMAWRNYVWLLLISLFYSFMMGSTRMDAERGISFMQAGMSVFTGYFLAIGVGMLMYLQLLQMTTYIPMALMFGSTRKDAWLCSLVFDFVLMTLVLSVVQLVAGLGLHQFSSDLLVGEIIGCFGIIGIGKLIGAVASRLTGKARTVMLVVVMFLFIGICVAGGMLIGMSVVEQTGILGAIANLYVRYRWSVILVSALVFCAGNIVFAKAVQKISVVM